MSKGGYDNDLGVAKKERKGCSYQK
jgi:hypothetical protein